VSDKIPSTTPTTSTFIFRIDSLPEFATGNPIPNQIAKEGHASSFIVDVATFTDTDAGDTLVWSASIDGQALLPPWLTFDPMLR
jgi:hypothetical protein